MTFLDIAENMQQVAIETNGLLIPIRMVEGTLSKYTHPLVIWRDDEIFNCTLMGSGIGISYRNKFFLLCTRHQIRLLGGDPHENIGILLQETREFCSSAGIRYYRDANDHDAHDLVALDFTPVCEDQEEIKTKFFNLQNLPPEVPSDQIVAFLASGYPSNDQTYDLAAENRHIGFLKRNIVCNLAPQNEQTPDETVLTLTPEHTLTGDPDGISGGGVFVIVNQHGRAHAFFAGIIVRAGVMANKLHIVKSGYIKNFLDAAIDP